MSVFLSNAVIAFLLAEFVLLVLMGISLFYVVRIVRLWDYNALTSLQYSLEKQNDLRADTKEQDRIYKIVLLFK